MEVVTANPGAGAVPPFRDHDVREWSRIDSITGALERARLETDHWSASTLNSSHKYGKVVDSVARCTDAGLRQSASRQLEVFHSSGPQGRVQVVRTRQTATTRWTNGTITSAESVVGKGACSGGDFENLQLPLNTLDLTSQKSKASVGRSAARRPPTRHRLKESILDVGADPLHQAHLTAATNLHRVSRLCHQIHETAVRQAFGNRTPRPIVTEPEREIVIQPEHSVEICEIESIPNDCANSHNNLVRTKSSSSDDINANADLTYTNNKSVEDLDDLEQLQNWRRTSKIRRSLQFPKQQSKSPPSKPLDLPENSVSVKKIKEDLEKGRRLNTALRNNSVDLEALDQILQSISSSSSDRASDDVEGESPRKQKRNSFVTVESIKEVKDRLRRTSSPTSDIYKLNGKDDDPDDGIVTEETNTSDKEMPVMEKSRVKSYVYGMENLLNKNPGIGTGSLESRVKLVNGTFSMKNEDWYNRRKSYGFEEVHNHEESSNSISLKTKNLVESSTDSGICKSSEIMTPSIRNKSETSDNEQKHNGLNEKKINGINFGQVKKLATTYQQEEKKSFVNSPINDFWSRRQHKDADSHRSKSELESTTITIPIVKNNNVIDLTWNEDPEKEAKRHSIAVDESKYVTKNSNETKYRRTSLASNDQFFKTDDEDGNPNRRTKKVEFCKTEVHFAAESGKVNIVATDEKPPPTQNFRRRRRNSGPLPEDFNKNGLPVLHFGDSSYEKSMFGITDEANPAIYENLQPRVPLNLGLVTVNTNSSTNNEATDADDDRKDLTDNEIKGILKNKPIKPKPYHLGETVPFSDLSSDEENKWGVKLRHVEKQEVPIWKSTVTVHNYFEKQQPQQETRDQPEFQKLLKNLRPTRKQPEYTSDGDTKYPVAKKEDRNPASWSAGEDRVKASMDDAVLEHKGYSTRITFGEGETTVVENDNYDRTRHPTWPRGENLSKDSLERLSTTDLLSQVENNRNSRSNPSKYVPKTPPNFSPIAAPRSLPTHHLDLKPIEKLSSPSLVGRNHATESVMKGRLSPSKEFKNTVDKKLQSRSSSEGAVLRTPKKSEMTYFGVNISPKPTKKISQAVIRKENKLSEKPDLLQHYKKSSSPTRSINKTSKPRQKTPERNSEPIYENIKNKHSREFDSSILDELTKAADQILQAVNGYTDEEHYSKGSTENEDKRRTEQLDTIVESKSWKKETRTDTTRPPNTKTKLKHTSSTSSVESLSRRRATPEQSNKTAPRKKQEKPDTNVIKATTKARRLQRASSREALLQSHGSSSEDLPSNVEMPVRKPRLVKKTKAVQLTMTNGLEMKKMPTTSTPRKKEDSAKGEERILGSLPEIRHKTAVSTIRSTADRSTRDRTKQKSDEVKKKSSHKRDTSKVTNSSTCSRERSKASSTAGKETVTHRISTANIKKCYRSEGAVRH